MNTGCFFEGLSAEATICAHCGYCRAVCPTYAQVGWESCSPRGRVQFTRLLLDGENLSPAHATRLFECTLCGHCTLVCPVKIDLRQFWLAARHQVILRQAQGTAGRSLGPEGLARTHENVANTANVYAYPNDERLDWADYMPDAPDHLFRRDRAEVLYFVGCVSSFSPSAQVIPEAFVRVLSAAEVDFTVLGKDERCCGFPLQAAGFPEEVERLKQYNLEQALARGVETVVFTCPACRLMWLEEYAPALPEVRLLHATEFVVQLLADGRLRLNELERVVTYHDPCDLGRNAGVYDAPRQVLAAIPGLRVAEVRERRERGLCCGGGGDLEMVNAELVARVASGTVNRLAATGADTIVTACQQCLRTLDDAAKRGGLGVEVVDVVQLTAQALPATRQGG